MMNRRRKHSNRKVIAAQIEQQHALARTEQHDNDSKWHSAIKVVRSSARRYPSELLRSAQLSDRAPQPYFPPSVSGGRVAPLPHVDLHVSTAPGSDISEASAGRTPDSLREAFQTLQASDFAAIWLGHASVLLRLGRTTVLTDPVLSERIGPMMGGVKIGLARLHENPIDITDLPPIDIISISHAHFDHLDKETLRRLRSERTVVVTAKRTHRLIPRGFGRVIELGWERRTRINGLRFAALRPSHWGARTGWDRYRGYNSYVIESDSRRVLFAGDTAQTAAFSHLRGVDLAIFGVGAYDPWVRAHATPEQVWAMFAGMNGEIDRNLQYGSAGSGMLMPIHHSTFKLSDEHPDEPMQRLLNEAARLSGNERIIQCQPGELWMPR